MTENCAILGVSLPPQFVNVLAQLQGDKDVPTIDHIAKDVTPESEKVTPVSREVPIESELANKEAVVTKEEENK